MRRGVIPDAPPGVFRQGTPPATGGDAGGQSDARQQREPKEGRRVSFSVSPSDASPVSGSGGGTLTPPSPPSGQHSLVSSPGVSATSSPAKPPPSGQQQQAGVVAPPEPPAAEQAGAAATPSVTGLTGPPPVAAAAAAPPPTPSPSTQPQPHPLPFPQDVPWPQLLQGAQWEYQDPSGEVHAGFAASKICVWQERGWFRPDTPLRCRGMVWSSIAAVVPHLKAALLAQKQERTAAAQQQQQQQQQLLQQQMAAVGIAPTTAAAAPPVAAAASAKPAAASFLNIPVEKRALVERLFTGGGGGGGRADEAALARQPRWFWIDPHDRSFRGPDRAEAMIREYLEANFDPHVLMVGIEPAALAAPGADLRPPGKLFFKPVGLLLQLMESGQKYAPLRPDELEEARAPGARPAPGWNEFGSTPPPFAVAGHAATRGGGFGRGGGGGGGGGGSAAGGPAGGGGGGSSAMRPGSPAAAAGSNRWWHKPDASITAGRASATLASRSPRPPPAGGGANQLAAGSGGFSGGSSGGLLGATRLGAGSAGRFPWAGGGNGGGGGGVVAAPAGPEDMMRLMGPGEGVKLAAPTAFLPQQHYTVTELVATGGGGMHMAEEVSTVASTVPLQTQSGAFPLHSLPFASFLQQQQQQMVLGGGAGTGPMPAAIPPLHSAPIGLALKQTNGSAAAAFAAEAVGSAAAAPAGWAAADAAHMQMALQQLLNTLSADDLAALLQQQSPGMYQHVSAGEPDEAARAVGLVMPPSLPPPEAVVASTQQLMGGQGGLMETLMIDQQMEQLHQPSALSASPFAAASNAAGPADGHRQRPASVEPQPPIQMEDAALAAAEVVSQAEAAAVEQQGGAAATVAAAGGEAASDARSEALMERQQTPENLTFPFAKSLSRPAMHLTFSEAALLDETDDAAALLQPPAAVEEGGAHVRSDAQRPEEAEAAASEDQGFFAGAGVATDADALEPAGQSSISTLDASELSSPSASMASADAEAVEAAAAADVVPPPPSACEAAGVPPAAAAASSAAEALTAEQLEGSSGTSHEGAGELFYDGHETADDNNYATAEENEGTVSAASNTAPE